MPNWNLKFMLIDFYNSKPNLLHDTEETSKQKNAETSEVNFLGISKPYLYK